MAESGASMRFTRDKPLPKDRLQELRWDGWGYNDSGFTVNDSLEIEFTGQRYPVSGVLPYLKEFIRDKLGIDITEKLPPSRQFDASLVPEPVRCEEFHRELELSAIPWSDSPSDRLFRGHGHCLHEIAELRLRSGTLHRVPDLVVWPGCHADAVSLVAMATRHSDSMCLIPFGGGTAVSGAVQCPESERRCIVAVDTTQMRRVLWVDRPNLLVRAESGITGQDLEAELSKLGLCTGHEPDSLEFSTLGGWVATRASGMKKNLYGNIEDLVVHLRCVTPRGVVEKACLGPRMSAGPDVYQYILGSEGTLGLVTEVVLKVRPLPPCRRYASFLFPTFAAGVGFLREVALRRCPPASIRLMDNLQFQFGMSLKQPVGFYRGLKNSFLRFYITKLRGFEPTEMCLCTALFEGEQEEVTQHEEKLNVIAKEFGAVIGGEENGYRGYLLTFVIAYIRDLALDFNVMGESFETSVPWDRVIDLCRNVKQRIGHESASLGVQGTPFVTCRVTQTYDGGACIYFYLGFRGDGLTDPVATFQNVESSARDEILANGGSLSHHHGIGKLRQRWLPRFISEPGIGMVNSVKEYIDPGNVFASGNLYQNPESLPKSKL